MNSGGVKARGGTKPSDAQASERSSALDAEVEGLDLTCAEMREDTKVDFKGWTLFAIALVSLVFYLYLDAHVQSKNKGQTFSWVQFISWETGEELVKEVFFALAIAFIVIWFVELGARRKFNEVIHQRIRKIQLNVFAATFQRQIPPKVFKALHELAFKESFIRIRQSIRYNLKVINISEVDPTLTGLNVVQVDYVSTSEVKNIAFTPQTFELELMTEQPPIKGLERRASAWLEGVKIGKEEINHNELLRACENEPPNKVSRKIPNVKPGVCIRIEAHARTYKLLNDYEIWESRYPTIDFEMDVQLSRPAQIFGAKSLQTIKLRPRPVDDCRYLYEADAAMLPHQGVLFWWCFDEDALTPRGVFEAPTALEELLEEAKADIAAVELAASPPKVELVGTVLGGPSSPGDLPKWPNTETG